MPEESGARRDVAGPGPAGKGRRPSGTALLVVAVGLAVVVAGVALGLTLTRPGPGPSREASCGPTAPKLSVVGTGQASVSPDLLTVVVQVDAGGASAATALASDDTEAAAALTTFEAGGVRAKDISTSGLSLQPQYAYPRGIPTVTGYEVDTTVTATLRDISKSGSIIDAVVGVRRQRPADRIDRVLVGRPQPRSGPGPGPGRVGGRGACTCAGPGGRTITRAGVHPDRPVTGRDARLRPVGGGRRQCGGGPDLPRASRPRRRRSHLSTPSSRLGKVRQSRPTSVAGPIGGSRCHEQRR